MAPFTPLCCQHHHHQNYHHFRRHTTSNIVTIASNMATTLSSLLPLLLPLPLPHHRHNHHHCHNHHTIFATNPSTRSTTMPLMSILSSHLHEMLFIFYTSQSHKMFLRSFSRLQPNMRKTSHFPKKCFLQKYFSNKKVIAKINVP